MARGSTGGPAPAGPPEPRTWWPAGFTINQGARGERALDALWAVARAKGARPPERADLGSMMQKLPHVDHGDAAERFRRHWLEEDGADMPLADVMRAYRGWLERDG